MTAPIKRWQLYPEQKQLSEKIASRLGVRPVVAQILLNRKIQSLDAAESFLNLTGPESNFDPVDLEAASELVQTCIDTSRPILVYGDYDVDGMTSTALMVSVLRQMGATVHYYIPHRFREGYGLSLSILNVLKNADYGLLITLDCGISNKREIAEIRREFQTPVLILDHHNIPDELPDAQAILNPKSLPETHPCQHLCTVGIVYKFLDYFAARSKVDIQIDRYLDLVALGTVADVAHLQAENRILTAQGLTVLSQRRHCGLRHLLEAAGFDRTTVTTRDIGFVLAPRLNAAGRLESALKGVQLLLADEPDAAGKMAAELQKLNENRQHMGSVILSETLDAVQSDPKTAAQKVTVVAGNWHAGIIGITASQLVETFSRPAVVIGIDGDIARGSARSSGSVNLYALLNQCRHHFKTFGGHAQAAGFSMDPKAIEGFKEEIQALALETLSDDAVRPLIDIDATVEPGDIQDALVTQLDSLAPFGQGNPEPVLYSNQFRPVEFKTVGKGAAHLKATFQDKNGRHIIDGIGFGLASKLPLLYNDSIELAFSLQFNEWNGRRSIQLNLKDIK